MTRFAHRCAVALLLLLQAAGAAAGERSRQVIADAAYLAPQRLVSIGDRKLNLYCVGTGSPSTPRAGATR